MQIEVTFRRDSRDRLSSFVASGHFEIPETSSDEYSMVCAAVSALLQAVPLGLESYIKLPINWTQEKGKLSVRWPSSSREDERVAAIVETALLAVKTIAQEHPEHVRVSEVAEP